jgi:ABC-type multidrug transport system fused ATPase/permease subunit
MQKDKFDRIISFLFGASWAIVIFGALITFKLFSFLGFSLALFITIIFIVLSLFMLLALDAFSINRKRYQESKKQTKLLEDILAQKQQL